MSSRARLIEGGITLFSQKGYEATSPREIQKLAEVGQGSFYHHFDSKADLGSAALGELASHMCTEVDALAANGDLARGYLTAERDALRGCRIGRIAMEASISDDRIQRPLASYFSHLRASLSAYFASVQDTLPAAQLADLAVAAIQGGYVLARATGDPDAQRSAADALLALLELLPAEPHQQERNDR